MSEASGHGRRTARGGQSRCAFALALALAAGCGEPSRSAGEPTGSAAAGAGLAPAGGQARMHAQLARIAEAVIPDNRFLGTAEVDALRAELASLPATGWPEQRIDLHVRIAANVLRLGEPERALEHLAAAEPLLPLLAEDERARATIPLLFTLGLANLRWAETVNCVACHTPESCLLPIRGGGLHVDERGSRGAMAAFVRLLEYPRTPEPMALVARWLLNLAAMTVGEHPQGVPEAWRIDPELFERGEPFARFPNVAAEVGLATVSLSGGAVVDDLTGDGLFDVLVSDWAYDRPTRLFRGTPEGRFVEATEQAGLTGQLGGLNLIHGDVDGDGDLDVFILRGAWFDALGRHPNSLLLNEGGGRFVDVTFEAGLAEPAYPSQAGAFADYDGDGDLDLFVGNEAGPRSSFPSQLFRNDGTGRFTDVAAAAGVQNFRFAKGASWGDYDDDGHIDLYVSNLGADNRLYRNLGDGRFEDVAPALGVTGPQLSFPCWFFDYDNDGRLDLYVAAYVEDTAQVVASFLGRPHAAPSGRLYRNDGRGGFSDVTEAAGLGRLSTTMGANFGDLDDDGWLDLYLGTGYPAYEALMPNVMYRNRGDGTFADVSVAGGFGNLQKGHAVVFADIDGDGDQDVFEQMGGAFRGDQYADVLYRNPGTDRASLALRLVGRHANRSAFGARVTARFTEADGRPRSVHRQVPSTGTFGSNPLALHLGLGTARGQVAVEVRWPGPGNERSEVVLLPGRSYELHQGEDEARVLRDLTAR